MTAIRSMPMWGIDGKMDIISQRDYMMGEISAKVLLWGFTISITRGIY